MLSWSLRMKVAIGAARGLCFLHEAKDQVIYRDFKAANILLDSGFNPKLSDFGLAKEGPTDDRSHVTTEVIGTQGYAAPEYLATGFSLFLDSLIQFSNKHMTGTFFLKQIGLVLLFYVRSFNNEMRRLQLRCSLARDSLWTSSHRKNQS